LFLTYFLSISNYNYVVYFIVEPLKLTSKPLCIGRPVSASWRYLTLWVSCGG